MERVKDQQNATISGLKLRAAELAQANPSDAQLEELLDYKEEQMGDKDTEIIETKEKVTKLEMEILASNKLVVEQERSSSTMEADMNRLLKIEAEYLNLLDTDFGGKEEKMNSYMRTNLIRADCPEILIDRWNSINTFRLDESTMFLLCKLLSSQRLIKSRKMLIDFLTSTLNIEDVSASINDDKYMMVPRKEPNYQQVMRTPENPQNSKPKKKP